MQKNITEKALEIITIALKNQAYACIELSAHALEVARYVHECAGLRAENERLKAELEKKGCGDCESKLDSDEHA